MTGSRHPVTRRAALTAAAALGISPIRPARAEADPPPNPALVAAAKAEGTLTYYHNSDIGPTGLWTAAFTRTYDVATRNMRLPSYPLFDRWLNEERVGRHIADLIQITDPTLLSSANQQGFVARYEPAGGAQVGPGLKEDGVWYTLTTDYLGIGYNHTKMSPAEEQLLHDAGWDALADPRWKGRFGTATPASGGSSYAFCYMFLVAMKDRYGEAWFRKLAANAPDIYASKAPLFERLAAGEYAIMDQGTQSTLTDYFLKGAPVRWVFPAPTPVSPTVQSISAHAPHPNAARLFQEWSVTAQAEALWLDMVAAGASRADVVDPRKRDHTAWFAEGWFREPTAYYDAYLKDPGFADPKKPVIAQWNDIFNYQGGRKG